jgi:hypothetical protein
MRMRAPMYRGLTHGEIWNTSRGGDIHHAHSLFLVPGSAVLRRSGPAVPAIPAPEKRN